jgi:hypothetical protein
MIPAVISPAITKIDNDDARLKMADGPLKREIDALNAQSDQPKPGDNDALIALVLADPENIQPPDSAAKLKAAWAKRAAINAARESLKPKREAAVREAGTAILKSPEVQKTHADIMQRVVSPLAEVAKAWVELFGMSRELRDRDIGYRENICTTMPLDLLGVPSSHSPLGSFLNAAVAAGWLKASALPREYKV